MLRQSFLPLVLACALSGCSPVTSTKSIQISSAQLCQNILSGSPIKKEDIQSFIDSKNLSTQDKLNFFDELYFLLQHYHEETPFARNLSEIFKNFDDALDLIEDSNVDNPQKESLKKQALDNYFVKILLLSFQYQI
jgi:hypothetical protein